MVVPSDIVKIFFNNSKTKDNLKVAKYKTQNITIYINFVYAIKFLCYWVYSFIALMTIQYWILHLYSVILIFKCRKFFYQSHNKSLKLRHLNSRIRSSFVLLFFSAISSGKSYKNFNCRLDNNRYCFYSFHIYSMQSSGWILYVLIEYYFLLEKNDLLETLLWNQL